MDPLAIPASSDTHAIAAEPGTKAGLRSLTALLSQGEHRVENALQPLSTCGKRFPTHGCGYPGTIRGREGQMQARTKRVAAAFSIALLPFTLTACPGDGEGEDEVEEVVPGGEGGGEGGD